MKSSPTKSHCRRGKEAQLRVTKDIFDLLQSGKYNDKQIQDVLKIPHGTYYRHKEKIYQQARDLWLETCKESLELRALLIKQQLDLCIKINTDIAIDSDQPAKDRIEASKVAIEAQVNMLDMLKEGPRLTNTQLPLPLPTSPRPTTFPTIADPNNPDRWITDPKWIEENIKKVKKNSNLKDFDSTYKG